MSEAYEPRMMSIVTDNWERDNILRVSPSGRVLVERDLFIFVAACALASSLLSSVLIAWRERRKNG